ncbi:lycopene beta-cyclase CrtY [Sphingomonas jaspsi]|uniref:lycopene beta-cyclase CrtY n=1 Tax=Sphingomonas jaspsi TaxID=392409 RepID=UPI0004B7CE18|nr:lycopene beta-cyclase CrtY [Sphingomonas jaspsi]
MAANRYDLIILGGGLAGGLAALAMKRERPDIRVALVEAGTSFGGNHVWSFFDSDIADADKPLVEPLIAHRWGSYEVRFPAHRRQIDEPYRSIESEALDREVRAALGDDALVGVRVVEAGPEEVLLADGRTIGAGAVLDCRGLGAAPSAMRCGWQKFCGQLLSIPAGHGLERPIVMDACVDQSDGYRFVYCLPFSPTELFVEDTYYSDTPDLDRDELARRIAAYAAAKGWQVSRVSREETGVLPVVMDGDFDRFWPADDPLARGGVRAGLFHQLTSYSLPDAVRFASWLASDATLDGSLAAQTRKVARSAWSRGGYDRMLVRMLFLGAAPTERFRILERFYRLPAALIARFYAGRLTVLDRLRILVGKPPIPIHRGLSAIMERM